MGRKNYLIENEYKEFKKRITNKNLNLENRFQQETFQKAKHLEGLYEQNLLEANVAKQKYEMLVKVNEKKLANLQNLVSEQKLRMAQEKVEKLYISDFQALEKIKLDVGKVYNFIF